jgi:hypothetical protein
VDHDFHTLLAIVCWLVEGKLPGCDGFLLELYKYGPTAVIALLQAAINAFIAGQIPTVHKEEWLGALVALLPKSLAALLMTEFQPVGKPFSKFVIFSKVIDQKEKRKDLASFQIANGGERRQVMCVWARSGSNPGPLGSEPSALSQEL